MIPFQGSTWCAQTGSVFENEIAQFIYQGLFKLLVNTALNASPDLFKSHIKIFKYNNCLIFNDQIADFVNYPFDWKKIKNRCKRFVQIYSDNDPYISLEESLFLAKQLGIRSLLEKNAGHITAPDFGPYPRLLKLVLEEFEKKSAL